MTILKSLSIIAALALSAVTLNLCLSGSTNGHQKYPDTPAGKLMQVSIPQGIDNEVISYTGYTVGFNSKHHQPNYVAWELLATETDGPIPRADDFTVDTEVTGCAQLDDYRHSGFDRGHMCPAGDMKWDERAMQACFMLTNICPQDKALNSGSWKKLEEKCRRWAQRDSALIIVCGPILSDQMTHRIGESQVSVPERFFKVILAPYANPPRAIGFVMPNGRVPGGMQATACSVDHVEAVTGFDFFAALDDEIEAQVEAQASFPLWEKKLKSKH